MTPAASNNLLESALAAHAKLGLILQNLRVGYRQMPMLSIDRLQVSDGEVVAVLARSGVGKTTLLKTIAGTLPPISGQVLIDGFEVPDRLRLRVVARTLQNFPLLHWLTVSANIRIAARIRGDESVNLCELARLYKIEHLLDRMPKTLSGGERSRVSLLQATVGIPKLRVLLLDEPFSGLDSLTKADVARALFELASQRTCAAIFVTHDLHDACEYARRAIVLTNTNPSVVAGEVAVDSTGSIDRVRELLVTSR